MNLSSNCECCVCEPVCKYKEVFQNGIEAILNTTISDEMSFCKLKDCPHIEVSIKCPHMVAKDMPIRKGYGQE